MYSSASQVAVRAGLFTGDAFVTKPSPKRPKGRQDPVWPTGLQLNGSLQMNLLPEAGWAFPWVRRPLFHVAILMATPELKG